MRQCISFIANLFAYWLPMLIGLLMLAVSFFWGSVSLGLCGIIVIAIASLTRLAFQAVRKNTQDGDGKM